MVSLSMRSGIVYARSRESPSVAVRCVRTYANFDVRRCTDAYAYLLFSTLENSERDDNVLHASVARYDTNKSASVIFPRGCVIEIMKKDVYHGYLKDRLSTVSIDTISSGIPSVRVVEYGSVVYWISDVPIAYDTALFTSVELDHAVTECLKHRVVYELTVPADSSLCVCASADAGTRLEGVSTKTIPECEMICMEILLPFGIDQESDELWRSSENFFCFGDHRPALMTSTGSICSA